MGTVTFNLEARRRAVLRMMAALAVLAAPAAAAQDMVPALDPTAIGQGVVASNIARQAQGSRADATARDAPGSQARARATCARQGEFRAKFGADDPRVRRLERLCRQAGY